MEEKRNEDMLYYCISAQGEKDIRIRKGKHHRTQRRTYIGKETISEEQVEREERRKVNKEGFRRNSEGNTLADVETAEKRYTGKEPGGRHRTQKKERDIKID
jgi:hypothetical protein